MIRRENVPGRSEKLRCFFLCRLNLRFDKPDLFFVLFEFFMCGKLAANWCIFEHFEVVFEVVESLFELIDHELLIGDYRRLSLRVEL